MERRSFLLTSTALVFRGGANLGPLSSDDRAKFKKLPCSESDFAEGRHNLEIDTLAVALVNKEPIDCERLDQTWFRMSYTKSIVGRLCRTERELLYVAMNLQIVAKGVIGPFRYPTLYNSTQGRLIGYWDYGSSIVLYPEETFTMDFKDGKLLEFALPQT